MEGGRKEGQEYFYGGDVRFAWIARLGLFGFKFVEEAKLWRWAGGRAEGGIRERKVTKVCGPEYYAEGGIWGERWGGGKNDW